MFKGIPKELDLQAEETINIFQLSGSDREKIAIKLRETGDCSWDILGEVDVWSSDIIRYVSRMWRDDKNMVIKGALEKLELTSNDLISNWLRNDGPTYKNYTQYIKAMESLRLSALSYLGK